MKHRSGIKHVDYLIGAVIIIATAAIAVSFLLHDASGRRGNKLGTEFAYDIERLAAVDPALVLYEETAPAIETGFETSRAIAIDARDNLYIAGDQSIKIFEQPNDVRIIPLAAPAYCLAVNAEGDIYAGFGDHVEVYDQEGRLAAIWPSPGPSAVITSIAVSRTGDVFVADAGNRIVIRYDSEGHEMNRIGRKNAERNVPGFVIPSASFDVVVPRDGMPRIVNPGRLRIETYTPEGDFEFSWGGPSMDIAGFCGCCNPVRIALLPNDDVVTSEKGLNRIKVYEHSGRFKGVVAGPAQLTPGKTVKICVVPEQCQSGAFDVAADSHSGVYVLDTAANLIRKFTLKET